MIGEFDKYADITIRQISREDWPEYREFYRGMKAPQHFKGFLKDKDLNDTSTYQELFDWLEKAGDPYLLFGMYHGGKMIGQTSISMMEIDGKRTAYLAGSEITDEYRRMGLADKLYEVRMEHLRRVGFEGPVMMTIHPANSPSQKAAARNGFTKTGKQNNYGCDILVSAAINS